MGLLGVPRSPPRGKTAAVPRSHAGHARNPAPYLDRIAKTCHLRVRLGRHAPDITRQQGTDSARCRLLQGRRIRRIPPAGELCPAAGYVRYPPPPLLLLPGRRATSQTTSRLDVQRSRRRRSPAGTDSAVSKAARTRGTRDREPLPTARKPRTTGSTVRTPPGDSLPTQARAKLGGVSPATTRRRAPARTATVPAPSAGRQTRPAATLAAAPVTPGRPRPVRRDRPPPAATRFPRPASGPSRDSARNLDSPRSLGLCPHLRPVLSGSQAKHRRADTAGTSSAHLGATRPPEATTRRRDTTRSSLPSGRPVTRKMPTTGNPGRRPGRSAGLVRAASRPGSPVPRPRRDTGRSRAWLPNTGSRRKAGSAPGTASADRNTAALPREATRRSLVLALSTVSPRSPGSARKAGTDPSAAPAGSASVAIRSARTASRHRPVRRRQGPSPAPASPEASSRNRPVDSPARSNRATRSRRSARPGTPTSPSSPGSRRRAATRRSPALRSSGAAPSLRAGRKAPAGRGPVTNGGSPLTDSNLPLRPSSREHRR
jgi:hypothetical protein